jgi:fumarylpyruvate hydrolase
VSDYCLAPPPRPCVPIHGSDRVFAVHRIYCVGRNYAEHAREMGASERDKPFFFCKPADAVVPLGPDAAGIPFPGETGDLQHEVELVVALGQGGYRISPAEAPDLVWGYAVGLDMTRRDLQASMKSAGRPWEIGKAFDGSAPIGALRQKSEVATAGRGSIWLDVNGTRRQQGDLSQMIWNVAEILSQLSVYFRLEPGDLVFTGTPAGVGRLVPGDVIEAGVDGVDRIHAVVAAGSAGRP